MSSAWQTNAVTRHWQDERRRTGSAATLSMVGVLQSARHRLGHKEPGTSLFVTPDIGGSEQMFKVPFETAKSLPSLTWQFLSGRGLQTVVCIQTRICCFYVKS